MSAPNFKKIFSDVLKGYSPIQTKKFGLVFIKHFTNLEISNIQNSYDFYLEKAKESGAPTYQDKLDFLISSNQWSKSDEDKIKTWKDEADRYEENKSKEQLKSKRNIWTEQLKGLLKDIQDLESKRNSLIGETAEAYAHKKSSSIYIQESFFEDETLKNKLFSKEEYEELESKEVELLFEIYNDYVANFNSENFKKVALTPFFLNMFGLTDSIYEFYGKPIINLTLYQIEIVTWGKYFKNVLSEMGSKIPKSILNDPDKIIEYVELNKNYEKTNQGKENNDGSIVGATREDLEILGMKPEAGDRFGKKLQEKGRLGIEDLF